MKAIPFLLIVLIGLGAVYVWTISKNEGFAQYGSYAQKLKMTGNSIDEDTAVEINIGKPRNTTQGSLPPASSSLAATAPQLYQNPDTSPLSMQMLSDIKTQLDMFFGNKAPVLAKQTDRTDLQFRLTQAMDDKVRVANELQVLMSNPGITPSITRSYYNDIKANLDLLTDESNKLSGMGLSSAPLGGTQSSWLQNAPIGMTADSSTPPTSDEINTLLRRYESFMQTIYTNLANQSDPTIQLPLSKVKADRERLMSEAMLQVPTITRTQYQDMEDNLTYLNNKFSALMNQGAGGAQVLGMDSSKGMTSNLIQQGERATLMDLKDARNRMMAEKARLGASGSLDPVINARITSITNMMQEISDIIQRVESGSIMEMEIPIFKGELSQVFTALSDTTKPVPTLTTTSLPPAVANLLPPGMAKDPESQAAIRTLTDKYVNDFLKGTSFELKLGAKLKYTSENEALAGGGGNNTYNAFFGPLATGKDANIARNSMLGTSGSGFAPDAEVETTSGSAQMMPYAEPGNVTDPYAIDPRDGLRTPSVASGFDWKTRAKQICENARKMGLNPSDFGCMPEGATVSNNFSWRGYARMICNRLQTHYYTGTDVACGCPPINWPGWKSAAGETAL